VTDTEALLAAAYHEHSISLGANCVHNADIIECEHKARTILATPSGQRLLATVQAAEEEAEMRGATIQRLLAPTEREALVERVAEALHKAAYPDRPCPDIGWHIDEARRLLGLEGGEATST
jgi:hypothetical protein